MTRDHKFLDDMSKLTKILDDGDYVTWDRLKTHTNRVQEIIVTFDGKTAIREYNRDSERLRWQDELSNNSTAAMSRPCGKPNSW